MRRPWRAVLTAGILMASFSMAGCANRNVAASPPVLAVSAEHCGSAFDLSTASSVNVNTEKPEPLGASIEAGSPCVSTSEGEKSLYKIFDLPSRAHPYMLSVEAISVGTGMLSPRLLLLDGDGKILREIPRDHFQHRGGSLSYSLVKHEAERFLVVASDPKTVGQSATLTMDSTVPTVIPVGGMFVPIYVGSEVEINRIYSHTGEFTITARALPTGR